MSFATDFIDGFQFLNKRTEETLKIAGEMSKFFMSLASCRKDYHKALKNHILSGQKKLLAEPDLDGTVKAAFDSLLLSIEDTINGESKFTQQIADLGAEFAKFKKDNEAKKKKLQSDCDALTKEYNAQLDACEKSRKNYHSLAREAEKQQQALQKGSNDPKVKSEKIAQMSQKTSQAEEKARNAEGEYREVVRHTNEKQTAVYTQDMPRILQEFQEFEEMKVNFYQECYRKYAAGAATQPGTFQEAADRINASAEAVSATEDIASYVKAHATGKSCPPDIQVDIYGGFDSGSSVASSTATSSSAPKASQSTQWGLGPADANLSTSQKISKLEGQISKLEGSIRADEQQASALERMSAAYAKDPVGKKKADAELEEFNVRINENKATLERLRDDLAALQGGDGGAAPAGGDDAAPAGDGQEQEPVKVRGLYDYTAAADTELSFKEGDIFYVTLQDDSGWWYATIDDKQGFVPENYVEVVRD